MADGTEATGAESSAAVQGALVHERPLKTE